MILFHLGRDLNVISNMSHEVTKEFRQKPGGNPKGSQVLVRKPYRFTVAEGLTYQPQPIVDQQVPVKLERVAQISYDWNSFEKTLTARQASELYAEPAALALSSKINADAATFIAQNTWNSVGTPGTAPTTQATYLEAGDKLVAQGLPNREQGNLNLIVNRRMSSAFVNGMSGLQNPAMQISSQMVNGEIVDRLMGYRIFQDQTINTHTVGTYAGTPLVNGSNQTGTGGNNGTQTLITDGWTSGAATLNKGDVFTLGSASSATGAGSVFSVHPQTRISTGIQQQFTVVNTISDTTGAMSPVIRPAITPSGQYQNVDIAPVDNAIITVVGTTGAISQQGILMHKNAFAFVSVPLESPDSGEGALVANVTDEMTGLSLRIIKAFDYEESKHINRIDVLYDFSMLYGEMAVKIQA
jgi:hypothetical protein